MAIKLADVIENNNTAYPVINAHGQNILGVYNGVAGTSPALKIYWNSNVKSTLSIDASATGNNQINVAKLPFHTSVATNYVHPNTNHPLITESGGLITVTDAKLGASGGNAVYLAQTVVAGSASSSTRNQMSNWTELIQDFEQYETITALEALELDKTANENFFFAGYDSVNNKTRSFTLQELTLAIITRLGNDAHNEGVITSIGGLEAGSSGVFGDYDGNGAVTVSDMLSLLGDFGGQSGPNAWNSSYILMSGASDSSAAITPTLATPTANSATKFALSDFTTFNVPGSFSVNSGGVHGFTSVAAPSSGAHYITLTNQEHISSSTVTPSFAPKTFHIEVNLEEVNFSADDLLFCLARVLVTMQNGTTYDQLYYLRANGGAGVSDTSIGNSNSTTGYFTFTSADILVHPNYTSASAAGTHENWDMSLVVSSTNYIDDIKTEIFFESEQGNVSFKVKDVIVETRPAITTINMH